MAEITLEQLLASRENRWHRQMSLIRDNPDLTLLSLTVVMPGSVKRSTRSAIVADAAMEALRGEFKDLIRFEEIRDLDTGYEAFVLVELSPETAKSACCAIEDSHPLGRLMDIDVIDREAAPLSRTAVGLGPRRCLLCGNEARVCMRSGAHSLDELHRHIDSMIDAYVHGL